MTKLVTLRVIIPADDEVTYSVVQARLYAIIETLGTERLANGNGDAEPGPRVHWGAVDVLQGTGERPTTAAPRPRRKPAGQGDLA